MSDKHNDELTTIAYFANSAEAGMACELLLNNGIHASLSGASFGGLEPLLQPGGFSEIRLLVPSTEAARAQELYDAFFSSSDAGLREDEEAPND